MRFVSPRDVQKMHWKKWAAKHEHEELKEEVWLEPALTLLRKKVREDWTEKHRIVARKIFLEGGWAQKRLFDIGLSDVSQCQACHKEEGTEKHRLYHCSKWHEIRREIPEAFRKWEQKARTSRKSGSCKEVSSRTLSVKNQWNRSHFSMKKWESEQHKSWCLPVEGFKGHVATDGSLQGELASVCVWAAAQLDYDEEMDPLHGMYGSVEAEIEVQSTIKRAELAAFLCLLKRVIGPIKVYVDNKGIVGGLWRGERECIMPRAGDADLWIKIWEELQNLAERDILVEVEHVKAHRTKKEKKNMSQFGKFVTDGNEKADELAKAGSMLDEGFMAEARAENTQQEREEVYAALQYAASFHCSVKDCEELKPNSKEKWTSVEEGGDTKHRTGWCAEADKYRCMRCGRGSNYMKMPGKCTGPKIFNQKNGKMRKASCERS